MSESNGTAAREPTLLEEIELAVGYLGDEEKVALAKRLLLATSDKGRGEVRAFLARHDMVRREYVTPAKKTEAE